MGNETQNKKKAIAIIALADLQGMSLEKIIAYVNELTDDRAVIIEARDSFKEKLEALQLVCNDLKLQNSVLESFKEEASEQISELSQELSKAKIVADEFDPTFKHKGVEYGIIGKTFTWKHKQYTIKMLQEDKKLQAELVEAKVGFLVPKTDKPAGDTE